MRANGQIRPSTIGDPTPSALAFLKAARRELEAGKRDTSAGNRYLAAHLAALRAAAAVLAARPDPGARRRRPRNVWKALPRVEPMFVGWAAHFTAGAAKRRAVEAGLPRAVSRREANRLLRDAETFVSCAEGAIGVQVRQQSEADSSSLICGKSAHVSQYQIEGGGQAGTT